LRDGLGAAISPNRWYPPVLYALARVAIQPAIKARYLEAGQFTRTFEAWPTERREEWRQAKLTNLIAYLAKHVPAYHQLPSNGIVDLTDLPVVDKQIIIAAGDSYFSDEAPTLPVIQKHTGGSTGDPWNYPMDRVAWADAYGIQLLRFEEMGVRYGENRVTLGFPTSLGLGHVSFSKRVRLLVERTDTELCSFEIDPVTSLDRAHRAVKKNAALWYGYAGTIAAMAEALLAEGMTLKGPRLIVTMAEPLWPSWKMAIEAAFPGSNVVEEYGANDGGVISHRCPLGNFHLADNQSIVEVLDPTNAPCSQGVDGDIVITNFTAKHLPFLRYRLGDVGALGPEQCDCGRPGRTIARVSGRTGDAVLLADGREFMPVTFFTVFNDIADYVRQWQMVQPSVNHLIIRVSTRPGFDQQHQALIEDTVRSFIGNEIKIDIVTDQPLELTKGGKHKVLIRTF